MTGMEENRNAKKTGNVRMNVTLRRVRAAFLLQWRKALSITYSMLCVCGLGYPA